MQADSLPILPAIASSPLSSTVGGDHKSDHQKGRLMGRSVASMQKMTTPGPKPFFIVKEGLPVGAFFSEERACFAASFDEKLWVHGYKEDAVTDACGESKKNQKSYQNPFPGRV